MEIKDIDRRLTIQQMNVLSSKDIVQNFADYIEMNVSQSYSK